MEVTEGENLRSFLRNNQLEDRKGIALALNEEVIPKSNWEEYVLKKEDKIMIITATAGG